MKQKIATIFGASGFIGRHLLRSLAEKDFRIVVATRSPYLNGHLKPLGNPGQIDLEKVNIYDQENLKNLVRNSNIVINLVGILNENRKQKFVNIHEKFPNLLSQICNEFNIEKFIHISALGPNQKIKSNYISSKLRGEEKIFENFENSVILRPSIVFGPEDKFFNQFAFLSQFLPFLPLFGEGKTKFQPVYVGDVVKSINAILNKENINKNIYEIVGPEIYSFRELLEIVLKLVNRKKFFLNIPFSIAKIQAFFMQMMPNPLLTTDQVEILKYDNIATGMNPTIFDLDILPSTIESILPDYIYRFRKGGQFT